MSILLYILIGIYILGFIATFIKASNQVDKHPELDNPGYAIGALLASFGSWITYFWMKNQDKN